MSDQDNLETEDEEQNYEFSPEEATSLDKTKPEIFNGKKLLIVICISFSVMICGGLIFSSLKPAKKNNSDDKQAYADRQTQSNEFISSLQNKAIRNRMAESDADSVKTEEEMPVPEDIAPPAVSFNSADANEIARNNPPPPSQPPPQQYQNYNNSSGSGSGGGPQQQPPTHLYSSLVPQVQGSLFSQNVPVQQQPPSSQNRSYAEDYFSNASSVSSRNNNGGNYGQISEYSSQNDQSGKQSFYEASSGGTIFSGEYIGDNALWVGTIIPGVLQTAINTDLPGNILARTTQNIYDSLTGKTLLIPQGTMLIARYNSSISYAQNRVQIVWDTLIRPDGYQVNLEGAPAVDKAGMSGQKAKYYENWFEYIKAAGIITMFSIANSSMTESAANVAQGDRAASIAEANSAVVNKLSNNMITRAMNIQPTLTVENGTRINIMLNKSIYLPPLANYSVNQKYYLE